MARKCSRCGATMQDGDVVCVICGGVIRAAAARLKSIPVDSEPVRRGGASASTGNQAEVKQGKMEEKPSLQRNAEAPDKSHAELKLIPVATEPSRQGVAAAADTSNAGLKLRPVREHEDTRLSGRGLA